MGKNGIITIWLGSTPLRVREEDVVLVLGDGHGPNDLWLVPSPHSPDKFYLFNRFYHATCVTKEGLAAANRVINRFGKSVKRAAA